MTIYILLKEDPWDEYYEFKPTKQYVTSLEAAKAWVAEATYETTDSQGKAITRSSHDYMEVEERKS